LTGYFSVANRDLRRRQVSSHTVQQSLLRLRQIRCVASRLRQPGDRVSVPFNVACGTCRNCTHGWTSFCLRINPAEGVGGAGYHGADLAGVSPGDTVAVFGAGPVGLLAAHSSYLRGADQVFVVELEPDRLALAERFGATPVNLADGDPADQILEVTGGRGADCGIEPPPSQPGRGGSASSSARCSRRASTSAPARPRCLRQVRPARRWLRQGAAAPL